MSKRQILLGIILLSAVFLLIVGAQVLAAGDYGLSDTAKLSTLPKTIGGQSDLVGVAGVLVKTLLSLVGIFFLAMMIYAGVVWMKAMGRGEDVERAKEIIQAAIIGLIIVSASYAIANFVFSSLGAGAGGGGGGSTHTDGQSCSTETIKTGKWNCGAGTKKGATCDTGECQSPCRYNHADGECIKKDSCAAPKTTAAGLCPDDPGDVLCCFTP